MFDTERCHRAHVAGGVYHVWDQNDKWCECGERVNPAWRPMLRRFKNRVQFYLLQKRMARYERRNFRA